MAPFSTATSPDAAAAASSFPAGEAAARSNISFIVSIHAISIPILHRKRVARDRHARQPLPSANTSACRSETVPPLCQAPIRHGPVPQRYRLLQPGTETRPHSPFITVPAAGFHPIVLRCYNNTLSFRSRNLYSTMPSDWSMPIFSRKPYLLIQRRLTLGKPLFR